MYRKASCNNDEEDPIVELDGYNQQYSMILQLAKQFLEDAKQSIHKYLEKTKFPSYLNKGIVSKWAIGLEDSLNDPDRFNVKKERQFSEILVHLKRNIHEMIQFQKTFKKQFQDSIKKSQKERQYRRMKSSLQTTECSKFQKTSMRLLEDSKSSYNKSQDSQVVSVVTNDKDDKLRKQLRMIVLPKKVEIECDKKDKTTQGIMNRLDSKMNKMKMMMEKQKQRQLSILNIFQTKRIIVPDINLQNPGVSSLIEQIEQLKQTIQQKEETIRLLEGKIVALDSQSIVVERYTIPKSEKLISNLKDKGSPINLNFSFSGVNSPRSPVLETGFKKKEVSFRKN